MLRFPNKRLRAQVIAEFVKNAGYAGVVVFTCGNAAATLRDKLNPPTFQPQYQIVEVGPHGDLNTAKWWTPAEIRKHWPHLFDATSGHLPLTLMRSIAALYRSYFTAHSEDIEACEQFCVPTGSGETILCLQLAFPEKRFMAIYDNSNKATTRDNDAPLNDIIDAFFPVEYWHGRLAI